LADATISNFENLTPCERAVWSCCASSSQINRFENLAYCFERNHCSGLWMEGSKACSRETLLGIGRKLGLSNRDNNTY